jgi:6-phosphogluconolactonase
MIKTARILFAALLAFSVVLPTRSKAQDRGTSAGAVLVMTNAADGNEIITYKRDVNGSLKQNRSFLTGGRGSGGGTDPLGSQGPLTLSEDAFPVACGKRGER